MNTAVFISAIFALAFGQESFSDEDTLKNLTAEGRRKIEEALADVSNAPREYDRMITDRYNCLMGECAVQREAINKTVTEAVFKGMQKNKPFKNFQCISNAARETFEKINAIEDTVPENSKMIKEKKLSEVLPLRLVLVKLSVYVQDLYKTKSEELKKSTSEDARKKILGEVMQKMKLLETNLDQMKGYVKDAKFKFFEEYVDYVFKAENNLKKFQREGSSKILNCVA